MMDKSREILEKGMTRTFREFVDLSPSLTLLDSFENKNKHEIFQKIHDQSIV